MATDGADVDVAARVDKRTDSDDDFVYRTLCPFFDGYADDVVTCRYRNVSLVSNNALTRDATPHRDTNNCRVISLLSANDDIPDDENGDTDNYKRENRKNTSLVDFCIRPGDRCSIKGL